MGLKRANIAKAVSAAFKAVGDIAETSTLRRTTTSYAPSTGVNTKTTTDYTITAIFTSYNNFEIDKVVILSTDVKCLIKSSDLTFIPVMATDTIIRSGITYNILRTQQDPSQSIYTLQLRAT